MERKINWVSGCYSEIELVYERAESIKIADKILSELEEMALSEIEENCGAFMVNGKQLTRKRYLKLSETSRELLMQRAGQIGVENFDASMLDGTVTVTLSPNIQRFLGCSMFAILNSIENLDGVFNVLHPKVALELKAPIGGKKGLVKCEMLLMQLYPWLSITESSTDALASTLEADQAPKSEQAEAPNGKNNEKPPQKGFFAKLFGR